MCVYSMIVDHYSDKWQEYITGPRPFVPLPANQWMPGVWPATPAVTPTITPEEIAEFRKLLERAREYDKKNNEPDCELESKKQRLLKLAEELGVKIDFL